MSVLHNFFAAFGNLLIWWMVIAPWEQALRVRLGKRVALLGPGVHLRIPWVDRYFVQTDRLRTCDLGVQTITTKDGCTVTLSGIIQYRITDLAKLYDTLHHPDDCLINFAAAEIARHVASRTRETVLPQELQAAVNASLDFAQFGLGDGQVSITDFAFVRTYRIMNESRRWSRGDSLVTSQESMPSQFQRPTYP